MGSNAEMFCVEIETCVESSHYGVLHVREGPPQAAVARRRGAAAPATAPTDMYL